MDSKFKKYLFYTLGSLVLLILISRAYNSESARISKEVENNKQAKLNELQVEEPKFDVLEINPNTKFKAIVYARVQKKLTNEEIFKVSWKIKKDSKLNAETIHIFFLLPEMKVGNGAWAVVDFDPDFKLTILGQSLEDDRLIDAKKSNLNNYIGLWSDNMMKGDLAHAMRIDKNLGLVFEIISISDPSPSMLAEPLKKVKWNGKTKYIKTGNEFGEYLLLESNGDLSIYDDEGYITTYQKRK